VPAEIRAGRLTRALNRTLALAALAALLVAVPVSTATAASDSDKDFNAAFATSVDSAERQAQLVQGEDERLIDVRLAGAAGATTAPGTKRKPYRIRSAGLYTLVLTARKSAYTLDDLRVLAPQTFLLQRDGSYLLREHILVDTGATLALSPSKPTTIKMLSGAGGFVSIVSRGGRIRLLGSAAAPLTFTSWDDTKDAPDTEVTDGRSYILAMGQLVVKHANFQHLGFWSGRTGGLALSSGGTRNIGSEFGLEDAQAQKAGNGKRQTEVLPSGKLPDDDTSINSAVGEVTDVRITGDAFGFFVTGASGIKLSNVTISKSLVDGLVLHRSATSADVEQVRVEKSGADGIVITRGVEGALLTQVTSTGNGRDGIVITGKALATGPSPAGSSIRQFGNNVLTASTIEDNGRTGVRIIGGTKVRLLGNSITGGMQGILIYAGAASVVVDANRVADVDGNGIQIRDATGVDVSGNSVRQADTGLHVMDAKATIEDNTVAGADLHAITLVGNVTGTKLISNLLAGRGSSAIDQARRDGGKEPELKSNDLSGWTKTITQDGIFSALSHPLTVIWLAVALLLAIGQIRVRGQRDPLGVPYGDGPATNQSTALIQADQRAALTSAAEPAAEPAGSTSTAAAPAEPAESAPSHRVTPPAGKVIDLRDDPAPRPPAGSEPPTPEQNAAWLRQVGVL
jgi:hypothetical protein